MDTECCHQMTGADSVQPSPAQPSPDQPSPANKATIGTLQTGDTAALQHCSTAYLTLAPRLRSIAAVTSCSPSICKYEACYGGGGTGGCWWLQQVRWWLPVVCSLTDPGPAQGRTRSSARPPAAATHGTQTFNLPPATAASSAQGT